MHIHTHIHTLMHTHTLQEHLSPLRELNACLISFLSLLLLSIFAFLYPPHHSALHPFPAGDTVLKLICCTPNTSCPF